MKLDKTENFGSTSSTNSHILQQLYDDLKGHICIVEVFCENLAERLRIVESELGILHDEIEHHAAVKLLGVHQNTLFLWRKRGQIKGIKKKGHWWYNKGDILDMRKGIPYEHR